MSTQEKPERPETLGEAVEIYIVRNTAITSPGTKRLYRVAVAVFTNFLEREPLLNDLTDETVSEFIAWRREQVASETVKGDAAKLLAVWRWCAGGKRQWIDGPDIKALKPVYKPPQALTREQLERLFETAGQMKGCINHVPYSVFFPALLYVLWDTSERIGAVYQLTRENIDLAKGWLTFPAETRKGRRQPRQYKLRKKSVQAVQSLLAVVDQDFPFALREAATIYYHFGIVVAAAGLPKWVKFHTMRKCHATHLTIAGGDARASLGHSSEATTDNSYRDPSIIASATKQPCDLLFDPLEKQGLLARLFGRRLRGA